MKHKTTPRALFATVLLAAAMAVAFLAMPSRALADTVEINQANFTNAGGASNAHQLR